MAVKTDAEGDEGDNKKNPDSPVLALSYNAKAFHEGETAISDPQFYRPRNS
jgi:hypothetical protein